ncbi:MAG: cupin domain-containing protein [Phycisphaerae bacterium]|nr:cupin domain-containing protein [Phycisphaerae bacterium]
MPNRPIIRRLSETEPVACPCGEAYRIVTGDDGAPASFHITRISGRATKHRHARLTETYYCMEGFGQIELDDETHDFTPGTVVVIPPGVAHAVRGDVMIVNVVIPPFDGEDEELVE